MPSLTTDRVVAAAVELLDESGLDSLSMRRLGDRLGAPATTLYTYVGNKDELLDLVLDEIIGNVELPGEPASAWQDDVRAGADGFRHALRAHPWAAVLFGSRPAIGPKAVDATEFLLSALRRAGFAGAALDHAFWTVVHYVAGFAAKEVSWPLRRSAVGELRSYIARFDPQPYPVLAEHLAGVDMEDFDPGDRYSFGLDCVIAGLEASSSRSLA